MTENWYLVLELEFDPKPVEDEAVIEAKIIEKQKFWSSKANDFSKGALYKRYSQMIPDIKKDMTGENNIRKELIQNACEQTYGPIDKILKQIGKKGEIPNDTIEKIADKQKTTADVVSRRAKALGIKIGESQGEDYQATYDKYYKNKTQNAASFDGMIPMLKSFKVDNLYDFLYIDSKIKNASNQPCDALRQKASEKKKKEFYKHDAISGSGSKLCGQCELTFKDETSKEIYDRYLEHNRRKAILDNVKEIYDISGEITPEMLNNYIGQLTEIFKDRKLSETVLKAFCKVEKIPLPIMGNTTVSGDKNANIKICRCGCINDVSNGRKVCQNCGLELEIKCPKCGAVNDANIKVCKCGFKFENIDKAIAVCELAELAIESMDFTVAKAHLDDAERYWPGSSKVKALVERFHDLKGRIGNSAEKMREACANREYYEAQKQYTNIKKFFPEYSEPVLEEEMYAAIKVAEDYKKKAQSLSAEQDIIDACIKAYEACKDCSGVRELIAKYPPKEPTQLIVSPDNKAKANILSWTKSQTEGLIYYLIVRKEGAVPISINDGETVGRVSMCSINDTNIKPGLMYYYAVFAERAGVYSNALIANNAVANLFEISNVTITAADALLRFDWDKVAPNASVEIYLKNDHGKDEKLECNNNQSFLDKNLVNDKTYSYRLCLTYTVGGKKQSTEGIFISGIPTQPPKAIDRLGIKPLENDEFQITWENQEKSNVQFYFSKSRPEYIFGEVVSLQALESKMQTLVVNKISDGQGTFQHKGDELIYILATVIKSGSAVVGAIARASKGETVNIKSVTLVNGKIHISIDVPKGATGFVVLYRNDQYPVDISDVKTTRKYIPLKQYQYDSDLVIDSDEPQKYYFSVFAEFVTDGEKDYSTGSDYLFSNISKQTIIYSVNVAKKLIGQSMLVLEFESENKGFMLPDIDIVSAVGVVPMFKNSAKMFYQIPSQEVNGTLQVKIPIQKGMPKETFIKAFLKNDALQKNYQIKLKLKSDLKIS